MGVLLWIVIVGLVAGGIARLLMPGPNKPKGFVVTIVLGVGGALLATFGGQAAGLYGHHQGAGFAGATVGALVILFVWHWLVAAKIFVDHGL
ncbi:MAG: GlsB/YeaQ/YmgE family stress response membrane protein [Pseudolabrys sp.]